MELSDKHRSAGGQKRKHSCQGNVEGKEAGLGSTRVLSVGICGKESSVSAHPRPLSLSVPSSKHSKHKLQLHAGKVAGGYETGFWPGL